VIDGVFQEVLEKLSKAIAVGTNGVIGVDSECRLCGCKWFPTLCGERREIN
jgi:exosome complex RNA-binding protein Rrp4